jgi:hypothetical protein
MPNFVGLTFMVLISLWQPGGIPPDGVRALPN